LSGHSARGRLGRLARTTQEHPLTQTNESRSTYAGVGLRDEDLGSALEMLAEAAARREPTAVHLCNAYTLSLAARDPLYAKVLQHKAQNLVDGVPVTWFARLQTGRKQRGPVRGPSLMRAALDRDGLDHFLLGGTDDVLARLGGTARRSNPGVRIVGSLAPPFGPVASEDLDRWAREIRASGANVVWVGLGTPKQDQVLAGLVDRVDAVVVGVGAAFDFLSSAKREAPGFLQGSGLEWLYRLLAEPRRLWRRYLIGNALFVVHAATSLRGGRAS
jgi:N-acetylglucosaminyldiphosphoundecaprenol N-acetyl-beta-D-mannosaminyltransferase